MKHNRHITLYSILAAMLFSTCIFSTPVYAQELGDLSFGNGNLSYGNGDLSYGNGDLSYGNGDLSYGNGDLSYGNGTLSYGNGDLSYGNGDLSYGNGDLSYGNGDLSYGNDDLSYGNQNGDLSYGNEMYYQGQTHGSPYYGGVSSYGRGPTIINNNYAFASAVAYANSGSQGMAYGRPSVYSPYPAGGGYYPHSGNSYSYSYPVQYGQGGAYPVQPPNEGAPYIHGTTYTNTYSMNTQPGQVYSGTYSMFTAPAAMYTNAHPVWTTNYNEFTGGSGSYATSKSTRYVSLDQSYQLSLAALPYTGIDVDPVVQAVLYLIAFGFLGATLVRYMVHFAETSHQY
jgi:hypothetical protein